MASRISGVRTRWVAAFPWVERQFIALRGDLEYLGKYLGLPHFQAMEPCTWCRCSRASDTAHPWTDWRLTASWWGTVWQREANWAPRKSAMFVRLGLHSHNVLVDWLHCAHLGFYQYVAGSVLQVLLQLVPGASLEKRLDTIFGGIQRQYKERFCHTCCHKMAKQHMPCNGSYVHILMAAAIALKHMLPLMKHMLPLMKHMLPLMKHMLPLM